MNSLVSRSLQILGNTAVDIGKDYTSNLTSLVTDAQNVKNSLIRTSTDASDTYTKLKNTNITKKISDWFYDRENESDANMSGDEFDAGFKVDSSDDHPLDGETKARVLDFASMTDISEKQTAAMYKVGRRQTEQTVANTAEIVSTINTRTSEMIASMNNINKTLMGINDNLNKLVQASVVTGDNSPSAVDKGGLFSNGKLTLTGILEASKQALSSNSLVSFGQSFLSAMQQGVLTPETLLKEALSMTVLNKPMIGGKSINDIGKSFNDAIGTAIQTGFSEILGSKFFKDVVKIESDKDYSTLVKSSYDTKKAQFDGMTRMSIVSVIPEYLNKINESLSGRSYHVDNMGKLVEGPRPNKFAAVAENLSTNSGLTNKVFGKIEQAMQTVMPGKQINSDDIDFAARALAMTISWNMHYTGKRVFNVSDLKKDLSPYMTTAGEVCAASGKNRDPKYWGMIMQTIVMQLSSGLMDASSFTQNVNQMLQNTIQAASDFAQSSSPDANQASKITYDMAVQALYKSSGIKPTTTTPTAAGDNANNGKSTVSDGKLGKADKNDPTLASTNEYLRGIFGILNRGIDVKVTNKRNSTKGYGDYKLERVSTTKEVVDDKFGSLMMGQLTGEGKADDETTLKNLVRSGMEEAKKTLLGPEGAEAFNNAQNNSSGGMGFFSNFMSNLGASGARDLFSRVKNGTLKDDVKQFFGEGGKFRETAGKIKNKLTGQVNEYFGNDINAMKYDDRYRDAKQAATDIGNNVLNKGKSLTGQVMDKIKGTGAFQKVYGLYNERQYNLDTTAMNRAKENLQHTYSDNMWDNMHAQTIARYVQAGEYTLAEKEVGYISDENLKSVINGNLKTLADINKKRADGQTALANGETPDIGAVLPSSDGTVSSDAGDDKKSGGIIGIVKKGFSMVGKYLGTIAKLEAKGATNIMYGLKSMKEGFFGGKKLDSDGNVVRDENGNVVRERGLFQMLASDPIKKVYGGVSKVGKNIYGWGKNTATKAADRVWNGKQDENGNRTTGGLKSWQVIRGSDSTVEDLVKAPAKTLGKIIGDLGDKFKSFAEKNLPTFIKGFKKVTGLFKKNRDEKGLFGKAWDKVKNSKAGQLVGSFGSGLTKGFKQAKAAQSKLNDKAERASTFANRALGDIWDVILGKSNEKSAFTVLCETIQGVRDDMNKNHEEDLANDDENGTTTDNDPDKTKTDNTTSGTTTSTVDDNKTSETSTTDSTKTSSTTTTVNTGVASVDTEWTVTSGSSSGGGGEGKSGGKMFNFLKDALGNIGKILGGFGQVMLGIFQSVLGAVMALEGVQAVLGLFQGIIPSIVEPLNGVFTTLYDAIKPTIDAFTDIFKGVSEAITAIVSVLIDLFKPIFDAFTDIFDQIFTTLSPILDMITSLANVVFVPLMIAINIITPVIQLIGYTTQMIGGAVNIGFGSVVGLLGLLLTGVGRIISVVSKSTGNEIESRGKEMAQQGVDMVTQGASMVKQGLHGIGDTLSSMFNGSDDDTTDDDTKSTAKVNTDNVDVNGGAMGSGDVVNNSYVYNNTYGSGNKNIMNQHTYGNYMNMSERGCGPVALADAYSRRTGISMSPMSLASNMAGSGAYEPNRGTSVGSLVRTGNALGMNMHVGGVTQSSLKRATPNNPITLLGSGSDYGTRRGNDHYVNVIGTDRNGGAYVSNPMTGRVERRSTSTLAQNARLGLYGSGDSDGSEFFSFDEDTTNAFTKLKNLTSKLTGMFTGDSTSDKMSKTISAADDESKAARVRSSFESDEQFAEAEAQAYEKFKSDYPKHANETDEEYETRLKTLWGNKKIYNKYIVKYAGQSVLDNQKSITEGITSSIDKLNSEVIENSKAADRWNLSGDAAGGSGTLSSAGGAKLYDFGNITHMTTNVTSDTSDESPLHDFFSATGGDHAYSTNGNWFSRRNKPDSTGTGTVGTADHGGVDFLWNNAAGEDVTAGKELHATTDGVVTKATPETGTGNMIRWKDSAGWYHWYMHMADSPLKQVGENVKAGDLLGYAGTTGESSGPHLHYTIRDTEAGSSSDGRSINPLTYFNVVNQKVGDFSGSSNAEKIWNYLRSYGFTKESTAGVMGNMQEESGFISNNMQNSYEGTYNDETYTAAVDNGSYTNFANDSIGYGLTQWTAAGRKQNMYNFMKQDPNRSIGDLKGQLEYLMTKELPEGYADMFNQYKTLDDIGKATEMFTRQYEICGDIDNAVIRRTRNAQAIYDMYKDLTGSTAQSPTGSGTTSNGYGTVNSAGDAFIMDSVRNIGTKDGKNTGTVITQTDPLTLRQGPSTSTTALDKIPPGTKLDLTWDRSCGDGWLKTTYNGKTGYVSAQYIGLDQSYVADNDVTVSNSGQRMENRINYGIANSPSDVKYNNGQDIGGNAYNAGSKISSIGSTIGSTVGNVSSSSKINKVSSTVSSNVKNALPTYCPYPEYADEWHGPFYTAQNGVYDELNMLVQMSNANKDSGLPTTYAEWRSYFSDYSQNKSKYGYGFVPRLYSLHQLYYPNSSFTLSDAYSKPGTVTSGGGHGGGGSVRGSATEALGTAGHHRGSGDIAPDNSFWYDALINSNSQVSQDIPPLDESKFMDSDSLTSTYGNVINKYEIRSESIGTDEFLGKMSKLTFNVRAQRVEELLEELIEKIDGGDKPSSPKSSTPTNTNLFTDNSIPEQVTRLSRG